MSQLKAKKAKVKPSLDGRDGKGKFKAGNHCSKGGSNKSTAIGRELKAAFAAAVNEQDVKDIVLALATRAKKGDVMAAREVFDRLWGKAPQAITGDDGGPLAIRMIDFSGLNKE